MSIKTVIVDGEPVKVYETPPHLVTVSAHELMTLRAEKAQLEATLKQADAEIDRQRIMIAALDDGEELDGERKRNAALVVVLTALRNRMAKHDGCSRYGVEDARAIRDADAAMAASSGEEKGNK